MVPGDRLVCAFVEPPREESFAAWPLHVTIIPWFRMDQPSDILSAEWQELLATTGALTVRIGAEAGFGHKGRKLVNLIDEPNGFAPIERLLRDSLHAKAAWLVDETTQIHRAFRPHVTAQGGMRLHQGDSFTCDKLYIVEQKGTYKVITHKIVLGNG